ncbi:hypothetical protein SMC26_39695 [Actinomadura fulvescens]|uniref:Uncharacterized protein n=1 Tax=Actinomadura fulvescens TaxID=46160 RepID=A0ABP6CYL5_9ACTN
MHKLLPLAAVVPAALIAMAAPAQADIAHNPVTHGVALAAEPGPGATDETAGVVGVQPDVQPKAEIAPSVGGSGR